MRPFFIFQFFEIGIPTSKFLILEKKFSFSPQKCKLELCMSKRSKVLIYLSFLLIDDVFQLLLQLQTNIWLLCIFIYSKVEFLTFYFTLQFQEQTPRILEFKPAGLNFQYTLQLCCRYIIIRTESMKVRLKTIPNSQRNLNFVEQLE